MNKNSIFRKFIVITMLVCLVFSSSCKNVEKTDILEEKSASLVRGDGAKEDSGEAIRTDETASQEIETENEAGDKDASDSEQEPEVIFPANEEEKRLVYAFSAIDKVISSDVENGFTSAQIAVMKDGRIIYSDAFGFINSYDGEGVRLTEGKKADKYTLYDLASNTKMYSVVYAMELLASQGKVDMDSTVVDIMGEEFAGEVSDVCYSKGKAADHETQVEWKKKITLRNLLCHRAGFPDSIHYYDPEFSVEELKHIDGAVNKLYQGDDFSRDNAWQLFCKTPLFNAPGGEPIYSDIDYMVLALVLEKITGSPLEEYLKENFWEAMGLGRIAYNPLENGFTKDEIAATELHGNTRDGYVYFPGIRENLLQGEVHDECAYYTMDGISGHAGMFANATDLAKLCSLMIDGTYDGKVYFSNDVINDFCKPVSAEYDGWGTGWWRHGESGAREYYFSGGSSFDTIGHQGWTGTLTMIDRENKLVLVLLTNKINSPVTDKASDPNMFDGKWYTTSNLGFASAMIYAALNAGDENETVSNLLAEFDNCIKASEKKMNSVKGAGENHPAKLAFSAITAAKEQWEKDVK